MEETRGTQGSRSAVQVRNFHFHVAGQVAMGDPNLGTEYSSICLPNLPKCDATACFEVRKQRAESVPFFLFLLTAVRLMVRVVITRVRSLDWE